MLRSRSTPRLALAAALAAATGLSLAMAAPSRSGTAEWRTIGGSYREQFYSPLDQINDRNAGKLGLAWSVELGTNRGVEGSPLFSDGVLYNIVAWNVASAIDARTGKLLWTYDPKVPPVYARWACCDVVSRGGALWKDKLILATLDGRLIALDRKTGKPVWTVKTIDREGRYAVTGAPRVFDGKVLIGSGGADFGARGYVTAYDADTGKQLWRFYIVPGDPAKPDGAVSDKVLAEKAVPTWNGEWWKHGGGGGNAWDAIVYDPELKLIYIGTGNGGPMPQAFRSPGGGDNLFLSSIVAVRADTGEYVWHYQESPGEEWDYTATQPIVLADLAIGGRTRKVLMQAPKNGFFYVIDRETGKFISAEPYSKVTWAKRIDPATGRPEEDLSARYDNEPRLVAPGPGGAHNWFPMAYSPKTGLVYVPVQEHWAVFPLGPGRPESPPGDQILKARGAKAVELSKIAEQREHAWLTAWDPVAQREVWRAPASRPGAGGTLATAGNLVLQGTPDRNLAIYRADTGAVLARLPTQNAPIAAPITYMLDGVQYVAVNAGWGGGMALVEMSQGKPPLQNGPARLLVYKLGGTAKLPPFVPVTMAHEPPPLARGAEEPVLQGAALFADKCAVCHGKNVRGGLKDLRWISKADHAQFNQIVLGGLRADMGMPNFHGELDDKQVSAIHAYVIARANEDYFADQAQGK